jgi:hypothetical protein
MHKRKKQKNEFRKIPGYENYYACSNGLIFKKKSKSLNGEKYRQLTAFILPGGKYLSVNLTKNKIKRTYFVHELIGLVFSGKKPTEVLFFHRKKDYFNNCTDNISFTEIEKEKFSGNTDLTEIKDLECVFRRSINYNYDSKLWRDYEKLKSTGANNTVLNYLRLVLKSKGIKLF